MNIKFITDSTADLPESVAEELDVTVLPLTVSFGEETFRDGIDITNEEFYARLRTCRELPKTSQINQFAFEEAFAPYKGKGVTLVVPLIGSQMSSTAESARAAAKSLAMEDDIIIIDSDLVTFALGVFVIEAVKVAKTAENKADLVEKLNDLLPRVKLYAMVGDLKYLRYGGRLSAASMHIANMLRLHPIITVHKKVEVVSKQIGVAKCYRYMMDKIEEEADLSYPLYFGNSDCTETALAFEKKVMDEFPSAHAFEAMSQLGPVVGTHAGPGCVGVAFIAKK